jgi:hypothetical protein
MEIMQTIAPRQAFVGPRRMADFMLADTALHQKHWADLNRGSAMRGRKEEYCRDSSGDGVSQ